MFKKPFAEDFEVDCRSEDGGTFTPDFEKDPEDPKQKVAPGPCQAHHDENPEDHHQDDYVTSHSHYRVKITNASGPVNVDSSGGNMSVLTGGGNVGLGSAAQV